MSPLVLDTHAWAWWTSHPERLTRTQRAVIDRARRAGHEPLLVSIISCWEIALLYERERIRFSIPVAAWLDEATAVPGIAVVPLSLPIILTAARLAALRDPADMLIVATALHHRARIVTNDERIQRTRLVAVVR